MYWRSLPFWGEGGVCTQAKFPRIDVNVLEAILTIQRLSIWPETEKFSKTIHCSLHMQECWFEFDTSYRNDKRIQVHFSNNQFINRILGGYAWLVLTVKSAGVEPCLISRSFRNMLHRKVPLTLPCVQCVVPLITYSFPLVKVVVVDYTLLSIINKLRYQLMI